MLVPSVLKISLMAIFNKMQGEEPMSDDVFADKMANAFTDYIKTGSVTTTVVGSSPSGAVSGTGTGSIK